MPVSLTRNGAWREVARFEARLQGREFLTWIYVAVFFLLTFGYTTSSAVELVTGRGTVPRNAPWALAQAMAGVTAFGQVITTMITATAVMRDVATRQQELLFTTPLSPRDYLWGRWAGALVVMLGVYAAIPVGLVAGTAMPWVPAGALQPFAADAYLRPLLLLVLPNVLVVSALFFTAGALRGSFMAILLLGVGLVALWTTGVSLARDGRAVGALIDPFGNAALEWSMRQWDASARATRPMPMAEVLLANRLTWLALAAGALRFLAGAFRMQVVSPTAGLLSSRQATATRTEDRARAMPALRMPPPPTWWRALAVEAMWTLRWTLRERGFRTLALLGALNALGNAWRNAASGASAGVMLAAVQEHARIFLILVATIYAGELVWRERDVRTDAMRDVLPASTGAVVAGKVLGIIAAEAVLVVPLLVGAIAIGYAFPLDGMSLPLAVAWIGGLAFPFLVQLTLLSLLIHAITQHKVAGHVALIIGWVVAVAMERSLQLPALMRFANVPSFTWTTADGFGASGSVLPWFVAYWTAAALATAAAAALWWVRGVPPRFRSRASNAGRRLASPTGIVLGVFVLLALVAARIAIRALVAATGTGAPA